MKCPKCNRDDRWIPNQDYGSIGIDYKKAKRHEICTYCGTEVVVNL